MRGAKTPTCGASLDTSYRSRARVAAPRTKVWVYENGSVRGRGAYESRMSNIQPVEKSSRAISGHFAVKDAMAVGAHAHQVLKRCTMPWLHLRDRGVRVVNFDASLAEFAEPARIKATAFTE